MLCGENLSVSGYGAMSRVWGMEGPKTLDFWLVPFDRGSVQETWLTLGRVGSARPASRESAVIRPRPFRLCFRRAPAPRFFLAKGSRFGIPRPQATGAEPAPPRRS